jgi:Domain of unknown function (DUF4188)
MKEIYEGRWIARLDEPFVVLLIGIRINKPWHIHRWLPLVLLRELNDNGDPGFLGGQTWFGRTTVLIQYWRSIEELEVYSKAKHKNRTPAWETFNRAVEGTDSVGVYHEFYSIEEGCYDNTFINMPRTLLSSVAPIRAVDEDDPFHASSMAHGSRFNGPVPRFWGT